MSPTPPAVTAATDVGGEPAPVAFPAATTRPVVLLGDPVEHSRSPLLHNTVFRTLGLDLVYLALRVAADDVPAALRGLAAVGCAGANVTVPHKLAAHAACDELGDEARLVGAVNTLWWRDGRLHGTTTDTTGLAAALAADVGGLDGDEVVLLGTGGAARAAVVALCRAGAAVTVAGRRPGAAAEVAAVGSAAGGTAAPLDLADGDALAAAVGAARVVVNATTLGMRGERLPEPAHRLSRGQVAYDLVYGVPTTPFVTDAAAAGAAAHDGRAMLAAQAADALACWTGDPAPHGLYRRVMDAAG